MAEKFAIDPHLAPAHPNQWEITASFSGMAHFAGTGPDDKRCRDCRFWLDGQNRKDQLTRKSAARCAKFQELTREPGKPVPGRAWACKYFEEAP